MTNRRVFALGPANRQRQNGALRTAVSQELIQLNEDSVWSGASEPHQPGQRENLPYLKVIWKAGWKSTAQRLAMYAFSGPPQRSIRRQRMLSADAPWGMRYRIIEESWSLVEGISRVAYTGAGRAALYTGKLCIHPRTVW